MTYRGAVHGGGATLKDPDTLKPLKIGPRTSRRLSEVFRALFVKFRQRALVGLLLMAHSFFYIAILFTYALVMGFLSSTSQSSAFTFSLSQPATAWAVAAWTAVRQIGRKPMIASTYAMPASARPVGVAVCAGCWTANSDDRLDGRILLRLAPRRAPPISRQRDFSGRIRALAIAVFFALGTGLVASRRRFLSARLSRRKPRPRADRLSPRRRADDRGRGSGSPLRRGGRRQVARTPWLSPCRRMAKAFSSEVGTGSCEENASKQEDFKVFCGVYPRVVPRRAARSCRAGCGHPARRGPYGEIYCADCSASPGASPADGRSRRAPARLPR